MKKVFLMAALVLSSAYALAQNPVGSWNIQPRVGMNIANLSGADGTDARIGVAMGAELEYQVSDKLSLSGAAMYSMQGCKVSGTAGDFEGESYSGDMTFKLDYINVPLMANLYVAKGLALKAGIQPGFNVNCKLKAKSGGVSAEADGNAKSVDFSIPVGLSYDFGGLVLDARYNWGLTKVDPDGSDLKNSVFQITLGYKLPL